MVRSRSVLVARVLLALFGLALAYTVLMPSDGHEVLGLVQQFSRFIAGFGLPYWLVFRVTEFTANIVMFVPLGVLLPLAIGRTDRRVLWLTVAAGALLSTGIELVQHLIPGRVSSAFDVLANTSGALIGVLLIGVFSRALRQPSTLPAE